MPILIQNLCNMKQTLQIKAKYDFFQNQLKKANYLMKSRHSLEIKQLLQKKRLSKSRFNLESRVAVKSPEQSLQLSKSDSVANLPINKSRIQEIGLMEKRFYQLEKEYLKILQEAKVRDQMCKKQQEEIQKYQKAAHRDKIQIQKLKHLIGFIDKKQKQIQTLDKKNQDITSFTSSSKQTRLNQSRSSKRVLQNYKKQSINYHKSKKSTLNIEKNLSQSNSSFQKSMTTYPILLNSKSTSIDKNQFKRIQNSAKLAESFLAGSKTSTDFRKRRAHGQKELEEVQNFKKQRKDQRINSPNQRFKFVPSVDL